MYIRITYPKIQCLTNNGLLAVGWEIHTYDAGGMTPAVSYSNRTLTTPNANPVVLNARGEADIYTGKALKLIFTIPGGDPGSPIWSVDYVGEQQSNFVTGSATPVTLNNNYVVTTTPAVAALSNNLMLIMTPDLDNADTIVSTVFTGAGINDMTAVGPYLGASPAAIRIEIDANGTPDTFKWKKDGGAYTSGVVITGLPQILIEGVTINFSVLTGHTIGDAWVVNTMTPARVNLDTLGNLLVYKNKGASIVAIDGGDMKAGYPAQLIVNGALNAWLLINPATPTFSTPTISAVRHRKNLTTTYPLVLADQGYLLSCNGTFAINLCTAATFSSRFVYVLVRTGIVTITANGAEKIFGPGSPAGTSTFTIDGSLNVVQLQSNGVDWDILTTGVPKRGHSLVTTPGANSWTCPDGCANPKVTCCGGGGGAGTSDAGNNYQGGSGGAGGVVVGYPTVVPGTVYTLTVGAKGTGGGVNGGYNGVDGAATIFGANLVVAQGGKGGVIGTGGGNGAGGASGNKATESGHSGASGLFIDGGKCWFAGAFGSYGGGGKSSQNGYDTAGGDAENGMILVEW